MGLLNFHKLIDVGKYVYLYFLLYFIRSEFDESPQIFLIQEQVPEQEISLKTAAKKDAVGTGQGFVRCAVRLHKKLYFKALLLFEKWQSL